MGSYTISKRAKADLEHIVSYTLGRWSEVQAREYYVSLVEAFERLSCMPSMGKHHPILGKQWMYFRVKRHFVFYRTTSINRILILRILHERMDLVKRLAEK